MRLWSKPLVVAAACFAIVSVTGLGLVRRAGAQAAPAAAAASKGQPAGEAFKNVTTAPLKVLTVDDFLGAMGVMAAALGYDCADCHPGAGSDKVDWVFDTPKKKMARKMVDMVTAINKTYFNGQQNVTCFTCHHGRDLPTTTIALDTLYGPPNSETPDIISPGGQGLPTATQILDKYIQAVGGAQKLATMKSFIATGTSLGYEGLGGGGSFTILGQAPDKRAVIIDFKEHPERGNNTRVFNGSTGWIKSPRGLLNEFQVTGAELDGQKLDATLAFPGQIKTALTNWRAGVPDTVNGKDVNVVQGRGPRGLLATLYFERDSGYLVRVVRYSPTPIGRDPTQLDFGDYRDVNGIKFPFQYTFSWLDGKDSFKLTDVKINAPVDAAKFEKP